MSKVTWFRALPLTTLSRNLMVQSEVAGSTPISSTALRALVRMMYYVPNIEFPTPHSSPDLILRLRVIPSIPNGPHVIPQSAVRGSDHILILIFIHRRSASQRTSRCEQELPGVSLTERKPTGKTVKVEVKSVRLRKSPPVAVADHGMQCFVPTRPVIMRKIEENGIGSRKDAESG
jgi:hypothetical protein